MPKDRELTFSKDELRELRLALALRIAALEKVSTGKMPPSEKAKHRDHVKTSSRLLDEIRKASK